MTQGPLSNQEEVDEKANDILSRLQRGESREEIARAYGNDTWKSIDMYMRRRGFRWENGMYVLDSGEPSHIEVLQAARTTVTKAAQIIRLLDVEYPDPRGVAQKQGFETIEAMGNYMKAQGYIWDDERVNYREENPTPSPPTTIATQSELSEATLVNNQGQQGQSVVPSLSSNEGGAILQPEHLSLLNRLVEHQEELFRWLDAIESGRVPFYKFRGKSETKTLTMASSAKALLDDFSREFNISQRSIVEAALAEYLKKYGYHDQVRQVTN